ncbi:hypothetical protein, partial [Escherichia coli]|uniref:hypothetical protein n=1 Tax=Escherichia coli TaxID=562 RepID=UPI001F27E3CD
NTIDPDGGNGIGMMPMPGSPTPSGGTFAGQMSPGSGGPSIPSVSEATGQPVNKNVLPEGSNTINSGVTVNTGPNGNEST